MIKFRQKEFSFLSSVGSGAKIGAALGATAGILFNNKKDNINGVLGKEHLGVKLTALGAAGGAAAGALTHGVKSIANSVNRKNTVDSRLTKRILDLLKHNGIVEGVDFTRDPKQADEMETKICIVVFKNSDELRIAINHTNDQVLKGKLEDIIKKLPKNTNVIKYDGSKYDDITISVVSDNTDAGLIAGIMSNLIKDGYKVYFVEVG